MKKPTDQDEIYLMKDLSPELYFEPRNSPARKPPTSDGQPGSQPQEAVPTGPASLTTRQEALAVASGGVAKKVMDKASHSTQLTL